MSTPPDPHQAGPGAIDKRPEQVPPLYAPRTTDATPNRDAGRPFRRPPEMYAGAVFLTLAALPLAVLGVVLGLQFGQLGASLRQKVTAAGVSVDPNALLVAFRAVGVVLLVIAVVFLLLAWMAVRPRAWARSAVTVLAGIEVAALVFAMIVTAPDPVSIGVLLLAGAGAALLYLPRSEEFLASRR